MSYATDVMTATGDWSQASPGELLYKAAPAPAWFPPPYPQYHVTQDGAWLSCVDRESWDSENIFLSHIHLKHTAMFELGGHIAIKLNQLRHPFTPLGEHIPEPELIIGEIKNG